MYQDITYTRFSSYYRKWGWEDFCIAYYLLGRESDLQRLVAWAERKRLTKPRRAYENRLIETQTALSRIRFRTSRIWQVARFCFQIADWLFPPPLFMRKGSAATYKYR